VPFRERNIAADPLSAEELDELIGGRPVTNINTYMVLMSQQQRGRPVAVGIVNGQLVWLYVDQAGQVFDETLNLNNPFTNFFTPNPANATFINTQLVFSNVQLQSSTIFGSPGILGNVLDANNNAFLMTTVLPG